MSDLIYTELGEGQQLAPEDAKKMIEDLAWQHKQKFWGKVGDKYIKKEDN